MRPRRAGDRPPYFAKAAWGDGMASYGAVPSARWLTPRSYTSHRAPRTLWDTHGDRRVTFCARCCFGDPQAALSLGTQPIAVTPKAPMPPPPSPGCPCPSPPPLPAPLPRWDTRTCTESGRTPDACCSSSRILLKPTVPHRDVYLIIVHCFFYYSLCLCGSSFLQRRGPGVTSWGQSCPFPQLPPPGGQDTLFGRVEVPIPPGRQESGPDLNPFSCFSAPVPPSVTKGRTRGHHLLLGPLFTGFIHSIE